jgi:glycosyltransferase involved in cell wall biosynthesis
LQETVRARSLEDVVLFRGAVDPVEVPDLLGRMDIAVAPYSASVDPYFSPLKLFEYLAAGLPVVASEGGQLSQLILHGQTGILCPPGDPEALASALAQLRASPGVRQALGEAGRAMVLANHTWDEIVRRALALGEQTPPATEREVA